MGPISTLFSSTDLIILCCPIFEKKKSSKRMLLSSNQVLRYVNALAVPADGLSINNIKSAEGAPINNILNIFEAGA
jgi:hypothetical protein